MKECGRDACVVILSASPAQGNSTVPSPEQQRINTAPVQGIVHTRMKVGLAEFQG